MDHEACNVIYIDRKLRQEGCVRAADPGVSFVADEDASHVANNVQHLLSIFGEVYLCGTGGACLSQWLDLQDMSMVDLKPTLILIDTPFDDRMPSSYRFEDLSSGSPPEDEEFEGQEDELYGLALVHRISNESIVRNLSKLVVPVPLIEFPTADTEDKDGNSPSDCDTRNKMLKQCLELGATDIMSSPIDRKCIANLQVHAYRAHRDAVRDQQAMLEVCKGRKRSWVGISEEKPFAYLREAMVAGLMKGICRIESEDDQITGVKIQIHVRAERQVKISEAVGGWCFCAHEYSEDELIVAAAVMFKHALSLPELEKWRIPTDQLHDFLIACRAAYNNFVPYHNFRHVVDVLQATFNFLVHIGTLPPLGFSSQTIVKPVKNALAALLTPFEALTLLIAAIGHDVGHPGVNNGLLVTINAPLAQLYNDRSVLESFHCAAYSQILRRHWPAAFRDRKMRELVIYSVLATDMGLHHEYMRKMGDLQDKFHENETTDGWDFRMQKDQTDLLCALLIKCADISNVARKHNTALQWMNILSEEFSRQATIEHQLNIPSSLAAPPKDDLISMARAQLGFMNLFATPLFQGVADILPTMQYCVDELMINEAMFKNYVAEDIVQQVGRETMRRESTFSLKPESAAVSPFSHGTEQSTFGQPNSRSQPGNNVNGASHGERLARTSTTISGELNGQISHNGSAHEFGSAESFSLLESHPPDSSQQRCSETTEGSSAPYSGDCASQATSAATGKMPISPSTQATSIISRDSIERPTSVPVTALTVPDSNTTAPGSLGSQPELQMEREELVEDELSCDIRKGCQVMKSNAKQTDTETEPPKAIKKRPSRFRINVNALSFFRKHKSSSPSMHAADTAG